MALTDLVTKKSVLKLLQDLFCKYKVNFKPEGEIEQDGFCADVPKSIEAMIPEYDVEGVINAIREGQSLNIPHQGYCMNKDIAIGIIQDGWLPNAKSFEKPDDISDDIDRAIAFFNLHSICDDRCAGRNCTTCVRYNAKRNALIGLNFYRQIEDIIARIKYLKENCGSSEEKHSYEEVEKMVQQAYDYANDRSHLC